MALDYHEIIQGIGNNGFLKWYLKTIVYISGVIEE